MQQLNAPQVADIDRISEPAPPKADKKAQQEEKNFIDESKRENRLKNAKHWSTFIFTWFCVSLIVVIILCRLWHILLPVGCHWLDKEDLNRIDEFFVDGSIGGIIVGFFKEVVFPKKSG